MSDDFEAKWIEKERKLFEAWCRTKHADCERHSKFPERYASTTTQSYWTGWEGRATMDHTPTGRKEPKP